MYSNSIVPSSSSTSNFKLFLVTFTLILLFAFITEACQDTNSPTQKRDTQNSLTFTNRTHHRRMHHFRRHHRRQSNGNRRAPLIRKRCRYSDTEVHEHFNRDLLASKGNDNYQEYNYVKHHQIRDGQQTPYLGTHDQRWKKLPNSPNDQDSSNNLNQIETERLFVSVGERINLTCNINTREIDWHFKDTNLTTTILSYGLQLQIRQPVIYETMPTDYPNVNYKYHDVGFGKRNEPILKYELSSDLQFRHQLGLFIEGSKDQGSYQCVDSKSETPIKKTIHVILKINSGALMSGVDKMRTSIFLYLFLTIFPFMNFISH